MNRKPRYRWFESHHAWMLSSCRMRDYHYLPLWLFPPAPPSIYLHARPPR